MISINVEVGYLFKLPDYVLHPKMNTLSTLMPMRVMEGGIYSGTSLTLGTTGDGMFSA